jgi:phospholipid/cholesterol/gamma-HCH transport system substrate-binding protein
MITEFGLAEVAGLLGAKYVGLDPGGSETFLTSGSQIENTQSAMVLEKLINRLFSAFASKGDSKDPEEKGK